jgi:N-acetylglucosaminyldiphosphoundecaprenol N-acetyl-beta-D-mannosaminyltransferase
MIDRSESAVIDEHLYKHIGVRFNREDLADVATLALSESNRSVMYVTCNLNHLRVLQSDKVFREAYRKASLITLDSRPIQIVSRMRFGADIPLVTGAELFSILFQRLRPGKDRPFFVSSSNNTGERLRQRLLDRSFAPDAVAFYTPPFGFQHDESQSEIMLKQIRSHGVTHLFMGVGAPKSECWVAQHLDALPSAHIFCVGAALDFTVGSKNRAPAWLSRVGFEWMHRLLSEPRRLIPRYAGDAVFFAKVLSGKRLERVSLPIDKSEMSGANA